MPRWLTPLALALAAVAWLFAGPLFAGRVLYFRDVGVTYYPDLVFLSRALARGVWPLWHPGADAGAPFLSAYPVHLLLVWAAGARATLALSPPLHVLLAISGAFLLARRLGTSPGASAVSGMVFGLSGLMLGSVLYPVFLAAAWAPLAIALFLSLGGRRTWAKAAALGVVLALEVSTLGVEVLPQTALAALALSRQRPGGRAVRALAAALVVASLLAAPVLLASAAMLSGTARGRGFPAAVGMSYSAPPAVLLEAALPRFLGDTHTFSDVGFWGQPFFPGGSPFFLSLYLGPVVLLLAALAGRREWRLWALAAAGVLLGLGSFGPAGPLLAPAMGAMRGPVKFFLLTTLAIALLTGRGLDRAASGGARRWWALVPGPVLLVLAALAAGRPGALAHGVGTLFGAASPALLADVVARFWPAQLAATGAAALGAGLAVARGGRVAGLAGALAVLDLLRVNAGLNPTAPGDFYALRPAMQAVVDEARARGRYRWFSYGGAYAAGLTWRPEVTRTGSDVWLYSVDRQALLPRAHVLDDLEGAFDVDRMGLAPEGGALEVGEAQAASHARLQPRLRMAGVRWVLSFDPIADDRLELRRAVAIPEVLEPLRLYEVRAPLPRAFYVPRHEVEAQAAAARRRIDEEAFDPLETVLLDHEPASPPGRAGSPRPPAPTGGDRTAPVPAVAYELVDPHTVRVTARTPPGFLVILDGYHPGWSAQDESGTAVPVLRANGRYRAIPTAGGNRVFTLRYLPRWRAPAIAAAALGLAAVLAALAAAGVSEFTAVRARRVLISAPETTD